MILAIKKSKRGIKVLYSFNDRVPIDSVFNENVVARDAVV